MTNGLVGIMQRKDIDTSKKSPKQAEATAVPQPQAGAPVSATQQGGSDNPVQFRDWASI